MTIQNTRSDISEGRSPRILYVAADPFASQVPIRFLISCAFDVTAASSGEEAWSLVEAGKVRFDVVITDHDTPRTGGIGSIGLVTKLRSVRYSGVIIILADNTDPAEFQSYKTLGVDRILRKPVELWELRQSLYATSEARESV